MDSQSINFFVNIAIILMGLLLAVFYKKLGSNTADLYYTLFCIRFSKKAAQLGFLVVGLAFVMYGV